MKQTPCLECNNLRTTPTGYFCMSIREPIDTNIVQAIDIAGLPDCPYYERMPAQRQPLPLILKEENSRDEEVSVKRRYTKPEIVKSTIESRQEILSIISKFYDRRGKWPTHQQVFIHSRFRSVGDVYNILNAMVEDRILQKKKVKSGRSKYTYSIR